MKHTFRKVFTIVVIFILGYICGKIDFSSIFKTIILSLSKLEAIEVVGFTSSIISLVLFIAYIAGRIFMIKQMKVTISESINVSYSNEEQSLRVVEEYNLGDINSEEVYLYSSEVIRWIKVYEYIYNEEKGICEKGDLLIKHELLKHGFAIRFNTYLPCSMPKYLVEYQRFDFMLGEIELCENGKTGILEEHISIKHTIKSIIYYLVK